MPTGATPPIGNKSLSGWEKKLFYGQGGRLVKDEAARHGLDSTRDGRGVAVADFDNDGRLDLFVTNADKEPFLYRSILPTGAHWIGLFCREPGLNRSAISAQVRLTEIRLAAGVTCRARPRFKGA